MRFLTMEDFKITGPNECFEYEVEFQGITIYFRPADFKERDLSQATAFLGQVINYLYEENRKDMASKILAQMPGLLTKSGEVTF